MTKIVEHWNDIAALCTLAFGDLNFVERENQRDDPLPVVPVGRIYQIEMVRDIVHYRHGATDAILLLVGEDQQQLTMIANDFKSLLLRRANGAV